MKPKLQALMLAATIVASGLAIVPSRGWAGTIEPTAQLGGPGLGSGSVTNVTTNAPNNDDTTTAGGNTVAITKSFGSVNIMDIRLQVTNSDGISEYLVTETVTNNSSVIWFDYHIELGFGGFAGVTPIAFQQSGQSDLLDFDTTARLGQSQKTPAPTSSAFANVAHSVSIEGVLDFSGGSVAPGQSATFSFSIDVPDSADCSVFAPVCPVIGEAEPVGFFFTLREFPTITGPVGEVPEPPALLLLGSGVAGLVAAAWRRRRN